MKEYVFSFKDRFGQHIGRFEGKDENEAFAALLKHCPDAVKLAAFEVDETLDKLLSIVKQLPDKDELADMDAAASKAKKVDAIEQFNAKIADFRRQTVADRIEQQTLKDGKMSQEDWNTLRSSLSPEEQKALYDEFIEDADKNHNDKAAAKLEKKFINYIFGIKEKGKWNSDNLTVRDLADAFGISHVRVLGIQKAALTKLVNNIAKMKHYPFKITTAEEAIALLMADNVVNPEKLKLKARLSGGIDFQTALKTMVKMERTKKAADNAKQKANDAAYRKAMAEFKKLERENNAIRDKLGLPRQYEQFYKYFAGQKLGN